MKKNKSFLFVLFSILVLVIGVAICVACSTQKANKEPNIRDTDVYRITEINGNEISVLIWKDDYWIGSMDRTVLTINKINEDAEVGDFINSKMQFVDTNGKVYKEKPQVVSEVFVVTSIDDDYISLHLARGPLDYRGFAGVKTVDVINPECEVGDLINEWGDIVDMFGNPINQ